jgi:hypothetical protein
MIDRRSFLRGLAAVAAAGTSACLKQPVRASSPHDWNVPVELQQEMYSRALALAKRNIRGGENEPVFKRPYVDAAFNGDIFLWDTCFIACYAKYHMAELPIANALDNFYALQETDGYICRQYTREGQPMWPKSHPVSINPPLLAFAELELYGQTRDLRRLARVYPALKRNFEYLVRTWQQDDLLFCSDAFGSGMDNIPRYPDGWHDDGKGIANANLHPERYVYDGLSPLWNIQGRALDMSAQMALLANHLADIARLTHNAADIAAYRQFHARIKTAINALCWNEADGFYYDLGYGKQIRRKHIGMFWTLLADVVPDARLAPMLRHLTDRAQFWRTFPVASFPADQSGYTPAGGYWLGSAWTPTNYMIIKGLQRCGNPHLAAELARQYYWCVAQVYKDTHTFWENYAPDALRQGNQAQADFCGWTAIVPITLYNEFIKRGSSA